MGLAVILGGGESGYGSAVLACKQGYQVWVSDSGTIREPYRGWLVEKGIAFEEGGHSLDKLLTAELAVKSPGIPDKAPVVKALREKGIPVISEIEFAGKFLNPATRTICITGSNGKTTTTTLIYQMLRDAGVKAELAGNIGQSFALRVAEGSTQPDWYVIELSSFQLDGMYDFRADIAVLLNITPDHLDRYDYQMEKYVTSKFRIVRNQRPQDVFVYNADDPQTMARLLTTEADLLMHGIPFAVKGEELGADMTMQRGGAWYDEAGGKIRYRDFEMPVSGMRIQGLHNIANALAAVVAAKAVGVSNEDLVRTLGSFGGVEHRMETAGLVDGVEYINDSKATNVDSVWYALQSMKRPTIWIAGGTDKGNDYTRLFPLAKAQVKALVCMGLDNRKLIEDFDGVVPVIRDTRSLQAAMEAVGELAESGDTVLLSPACASFDLFENYEDRGRQFKKAVRKLSGK